MLDKENFICEKIEVEFRQETGIKLPLSFYWREKEYEVKEIFSSWERHSFSELGPSHKGWRQKRHRVYYLVGTDEGGVYEIYWDRGSKDRAWVLSKRIR